MTPNSRKRAAAGPRPRKRHIVPVGRRVPGEKVLVEIAAGGVVFKRTPQGIRLAMLLDPYRKWTFAKGHVEKGETMEQAAIRETQEEMGLNDLKIVAPLGKVDIWFRDRYRAATRGVLIHKHINYFLMKAPAGAKGRPQKNEVIYKMEWVDLRQAARRSGYRDVRPVMERVNRHFGVRKVVGRPGFGASSGAASRKG